MRTNGGASQFKIQNSKFLSTRSRLSRWCRFVARVVLSYCLTLGAGCEYAPMKYKIISRLYTMLAKTQKLSGQTKKYHINGIFLSDN
jgi:hypothetical protein